ncbi:helix-turn-helix transcriptional regulator [Streptomyces sp. NPDC007875]|uniref:helix-turn-helix transcriptional regulator n=1 Tax=Streptomyces sp. NPDC007875 TaxID=3364783 RepID=UPI00368C1A4F
MATSVVSTARRFSGHRLREARLAAELSPERLALQVERSVYSIHEYERGRVIPPIHVITRLAASVGCSLEDLLTEEVSDAA